MNPEPVNWLAVIAATISGFVLGGLWYSQLLFGKTWMKAAEMTDEKVRSANMIKTYGCAFIFMLIAAVNLGYFLASPAIQAADGALYGFLTGFGWMFMGVGVIALFEQKSWPYIFINGGYWVVTMTVMGLIIGAWK